MFNFDFSVYTAEDIMEYFGAVLKVILKTLKIEVNGPIKIGFIEIVLPEEE